VKTDFTASEVLGNVRNCILAHNLNYDRIEQCKNGSVGASLLADNQGDKLSRISVPSVYIDERHYTIVSEKTSHDYLVNLCKSFNFPASETRVFPWWVFSFLIATACTLLIVVWVARSNGRTLSMMMPGEHEYTMTSVILSVFFGIDSHSSSQTGDEVLRLWQEGALGEDEETKAGSEQPTDKEPNVHTTDNDGTAESENTSLLV